MDLNNYIAKSHLRAIDKFNNELAAWAQETGDMPPYLYEDIDTSFTLWNIRVINGVMYYECDGQTEHENVVIYDEDERCYYEWEFDGIMDAIKFWRACLKRAKRYWEMSPERLDRIYDGEENDIDMDEDL